MSAKPNAGCVLALGQTMRNDTWYFIHNNLGYCYNQVGQFERRRKMLPVRHPDQSIPPQRPQEPWHRSRGAGEISGSSDELIRAAGLFYCRMANGTRLAVCLFSQPLALWGVNYAYSTWHTCCISWHTTC